MNTNKQINIMVLLVFLSVLATGAYTMWDPGRATDAKATQEAKVVDRGAYLFSQNCRVCHGDSGEGGAAANRVQKAPPLNRPDLQGKGDPTLTEDVAHTNAYKRVYYTISCGRVGTDMPTWAQTQGGPLNDEQIKQLTTMIVDGTAWDKAKEYAVVGYPEYQLHGDESDGLTLASALDASSTSVDIAGDVTVLGKGLRLAIDNELMLITDFNAPARTVTVERGLGTTNPAAHDAGSIVLRPPVPPDQPAITGKDTPLPCGQNLPPAAPAGGGPAAPSTTLTITAQGIAWDTSTLVATAGQPLTLTVNNNDTGTPHDIHFFKGGDATGDSVAQTDIENGPVVQTLNFGPLDAGDYFYHCDVHPQMTGTLTAK